MENWERKFIVDPEGNNKEVELSEEEKKKKFIEMHLKKKKLIRLEGAEGGSDKKSDAPA